MSQVYDKFLCQDKNPLKCSKMASKCNDTKELVDGLPVGAACSRTCGICVEERLRCSSKLCQNDAVCFNINDQSLMENSHIGFKCQCQPGFYGQFCELSKSLDPLDSALSRVHCELNSARFCLQRTRANQTRARTTPPVLSPAPPATDASATTALAARIARSSRSIGP